MKRAVLTLGWLIFLTIAGWAGTQTSKGFLYKPDVGARGAAEKNLYDAGLDRVDARLGKEIWIGDPNYGSSLQDAVAAIGSNQAILRVPAAVHNINADLNVPANVTLKVEKGATLAVADGKTLTISGGLTAGHYRIFSCTGSGKVLFGAGSVPAAIPQWWQDPASTDWTAAIQAAIAALPDRTTGSTSSGRQCVFIPSGKYKCNFTLNRPNITINGAGQGVTILDSYDVTKPVMTLGDGAAIVEYCTISHFSIGERGATTNTPAGILVNGLYESNITDFNIYTTSGHGIWLAASGTKANYFNHFTNFSIDWCFKSAIQSDYVNFGNNACFFEHGTIHGGTYTSANGGPSYVVNAADKLFLADCYIQAHSDMGMYFRGPSGGIYASDSTMEYSTDGGSAVTVQFDPAYTLTNYLPYYITGRIEISGNIKFPDGSTVNANQRGFVRANLLSDPQVAGTIYLADTLAATAKTTGQLTTGSASIYNNYNTLYLDAPSDRVRFKQNPQVEKATGAGITLKSTTAGKTVSVTNNVGNLVLSPDTGAATQINGVVEYADNAAAVAAGLTAGMLYRTGDTMKIVH